MSGIGLAYKTPEQQSASNFDTGARAVTQPPASPGIGMAAIPVDPADIDPNLSPAIPGVVDENGTPVGKFAAPTAPAAPVAPAKPAEEPVIDFHQNPLGAIGLVLSSTAAGLNGTESPVAALRKQKLEEQAQQYKTASLALDIVEKTSKYIAKTPSAQRKGVIADLDKRFSPALGGQSIAPFLTAVTAGDEAETAARMAALRGMNVSPTMMAYFASDPAAAVKFIDGYNQHQATKETPEEAGAKAGAVATATNEANRNKPITPVEQANLDVANRNAGTSAATLAETKSQHTFERDQAANKPLTADQANSATYADRMHQAERVLSKFGNELAKPVPRALDHVPGGTYAQSADYQKASQAKQDFLSAVLRKESGAVIGKDEMEMGDKQYFPVPGNPPSVIAQKNRNRATALAGISRAAGATYKPPAEVIQYDAHGNRL